MKRLILFSVFIASALIGYTQGTDYKNYFRNDSSHIYSWDAGTGTWLLDTKEYSFFGKNMQPDSIVTFSYPSGVRISKVINSFRAGMVSDQTILIWNTKWVPSARNLFSYDRNDNLIEVLVQVYLSGTWTNNRWQKNYVYNPEGKQMQYEMYYWRNNAWTLPTTDYSTYDGNGKLIKRVAMYPNEVTDYQILYNYNSDGLRSDMYAQYPSGTSWLNWWKYSFTYNPCGIQSTQVRYRGVQDQWVLQSKTVLFNSFNSNLLPLKKVPVCHNGHTIYISRNAVQAHLKHGDCIGECVKQPATVLNSTSSELLSSKPPFIIYPNPAQEIATIKFNEELPDFSGLIEITDFNGRLIRSYPVNGKGDVTISRGNLPAGRYSVRLVQEDVVSTILIFK